MKAADTARLDYVDIAKAIGMLTIMWGHIRLGDWSNAFVYGFHIPLFFFLSGLVFNREKYTSFKVFLMKKTKSLLVPYVMFSFAFWVIWALFSYLSHANVESYWMPLAQTFIAQGSGGFLVHNVPLWFVTCLFVVECAYYFISSLTRTLVILISIAIAMIGWYGISHEIWFDWRLLPWNIEVACLAIPIFAIGNVFAQAIGHDALQTSINQNKMISVGGVIIASTSLYFLTQYNGAISFGHATWGRSLLLAYTTGFLGTAMMVVLCILIAGSSWNSRFLNRLKWFGRHSFDAMAIHNPIKGFVCVAVGAVLHCSPAAVSKDTGYSAIAFVLTLAVTVAGMALVARIRGRSITHT